MWRSRLVFRLFGGARRCLGFGTLRGAAAGIFMLAQHLVIALLTPCHHAGEIMGAAPHIPLEDSSSMMGSDIEILLVAFNQQLILRVAVEVAELVALPASPAEAGAISGVFRLDQMMIDG